MENWKAADVLIKKLKKLQRKPRKRKLKHKKRLKRKAEVVAQVQGGRVGAVLIMEVAGPTEVIREVGEAVMEVGVGEVTTQNDQITKYQILRMC